MRKNRVSAFFLDMRVGMQYDCCKYIKWKRDKLGIL